MACAAVEQLCISPTCVDSATAVSAPSTSIPWTTFRSLHIAGGCVAEAAEKVAGPIASVGIVRASCPDLSFHVISCASGVPPRKD